MAHTVATIVVAALGTYAALGFVFALAFAWRGAGRVDPVAKEGTWGFRLLIIPGAMALWPLLLGRWLGGDGQPPDERNPHREAAKKGRGR